VKDQKLGLAATGPDEEEFTSSSWSSS